MTEGIELRHVEGVCCPDFGCLYGSWNGKTCKYCDADCSQCKSKPKE